MAAATAAMFAFRGTPGCQVIAAITGPLFLLYLPGSIHTLIGKLRVVPYFDQPVSGPSTYLMGEALLRNSFALDSYLVAHDSIPVSGFNSGDDFRREPLTWHDPEKALVVAESLLTALHSKDLTLDDAAAVIDDLHLLIAKLRNAVKHKIRFCLLLQDYSGTNGMEHATRTGTFFEVRHRI